MSQINPVSSRTWFQSTLVWLCIFCKRIGMLSAQVNWRKLTLTLVLVSSEKGIAVEVVLRACDRHGGYRKETLLFCYRRCAQRLRPWQWRKVQRMPEGRGLYWSSQDRVSLWLAKLFWNNQRTTEIHKSLENLGRSTSWQYSLFWSQPVTKFWNFAYSPWLNFL